MREIILKRLFEIKEELEEIKPRLPAGSKILEQVERSLAQINRVLEGQSIDVASLPREVKIDASKLSLKDNKLTGRVLLTDNDNVYDVELKDSNIVRCDSSSGGIKRLEFLQMKREEEENV